MDTEKGLRHFGFDVLSIIGEGCSSKVMLATSKRHLKPVAIKVMSPKGDDLVFAEKLLQELTIVRRVRHPHIVKVHEVYEMPNKEVFVVMEAAVTDLNEKIMDFGCIYMDQAREWFSQLVSAMVYLHQQDIAHRDLKCANILLTADGQIRLTDFGFGCFTKGYPDLTQTFIGTPFYTAPEVLKFEAYDPKKSDVWSMGVILYTMVTGELPFEAESWDSLLCAQDEPLTYPSQVTVEEPCRSFISYMLNNDPRTRPSMLDVARHPWLQLRRERDVDSCVATPTAEDEVNQFQEENCGSACQSKETKEEENGYINCSPFCAARKRASKNVVAPTNRAIQSIQRSIKKFFRRNTVVPSRTLLAL